MFAPIAAQASVGGEVAVLAYRYNGEPMTVGGKLYRDVLRVRVRLSWDRVYLGVGQSDQSFAFAPGRGLVVLVQDGVLRRRTDL